MQNVAFDLNGRRAFVSFISRYRGQNDYGVYLHPRDTRVSRLDDGTVSTTSEWLTLDEARLAIAAYTTAEAEQYADWLSRQTKG
jgi:hypothetical protein